SSRGGFERQAGRAALEPRSARLPTHRSGGTKHGGHSADRPIYGARGIRARSSHASRYHFVEIVRKSPSKRRDVSPARAAVRPGIHGAGDLRLERTPERRHESAGG